MRRACTAIAVGVLMAAGLTACGNGRASYANGIGVGRAYAATLAALPDTAHDARAACLRQWPISGSVGDDQGRWVSGCVQGIRQIAASQDHVLR